MHLVGFIIRIHHDARSSECQIKSHIFCAAVYCYLLPVWLYNAAVHTTAQTARLSEKFIEHELFVLIFYTLFFCLEDFLF